MLIEIYGDIVCPWCYIGEVRLEQALAQRPELEVELQWRPFQLQPAMPQTGLPWAEFARSKFGGPAQAQAAFAQVSSVGASDGITFDFDQVVSAPNTLDAHRLVLLAQEQGRQSVMVQALFAAYFAKGRDLNKLDDLLAIAAKAGLETEAVRAFLASDQKVTEVQASQQTAEQQGLNSVPQFIVDQRYLISGAQPVEVFLRVLDYAKGKNLAIL